MLMYLREADNWNEAVGGWSVLLEDRPLFGFVALLFTLSIESSKSLRGSLFLLHCSYIMD